MYYPKRCIVKDNRPYTLCFAKKEQAVGGQMGFGSRHGIYAWVEDKWGVRQNVTGIVGTYNYDKLQYQGIWRCWNFVGRLAADRHLDMIQHHTKSEMEICVKVMRGEISGKDEINRLWYPRINEQDNRLPVCPKWATHCVGRQGQKGIDPREYVVLAVGNEKETILGKYTTSTQANEVLLNLNKHLIERREKWKVMETVKVSKTNDT